MIGARIYVNENVTLQEADRKVEIVSTPDRHLQFVRVENLGDTPAQVRFGEDNDPYGGVLTVAPNTKIETSVALPGIPFIMSPVPCDSLFLRISLLDAEGPNPCFQPRTLPCEAYDTPFFATSQVSPMSEHPCPPTPPSTPNLSRSECKDEESFQQQIVDTSSSSAPSPKVETSEIVVGETLVTGKNSEIISSNSDKNPIAQEIEIATNLQDFIEVDSGPIKLWINNIEFEWEGNRFVRVGSRPDQIIPLFRDPTGKSTAEPTRPSHKRPRPKQRSVTWGLEMLLLFCILITVLTILLLEDDTHRIGPDTCSSNQTLMSTL